MTIPFVCKLPNLPEEALDGSFIAIPPGQTCSLCRPLTESYQVRIPMEIEEEPETRRLGACDVPLPSIEAAVEPEESMH